MKRKRPDFGVMNCTVCGAECARRHHAQKYCPTCSEEANKKRQRKYQLETGRQKLSVERERWKENGRRLSNAERTSLVRSATSATFSPDFVWYSRFSIPFSWAGSKNHIFANTGRGHTFMRDDSRYYRALITEKVAEAVKNIHVRQNKLWIDIYVQKPSHKGDAANFLDLVCDAIKDAIPLDDRWYSVRGIDWQIVKSDPMLYIGIGQDAVHDVQACSCCGRLLTFDHFHKNRGNPNGVARDCRECQTATRAARRQPLRIVTTLERTGVFA